MRLAQDDRVSRDQFLLFMESLFDRLDADKDGFLNIQELEGLIPMLREKATGRNADRGLNAAP
jgi:hypothetical protein